MTAVVAPRSALTTVPPGAAARSVVAKVSPGFCVATTRSDAISLPLLPVKSCATRSACHRRACQTRSCLWISLTMLYQLLCFMNSPFLS